MTAGPELEVVHGPVGARLEDPTGVGPLFRSTRTRTLLDIPSLARARVEAGSRVALQRAPGASEEDLAWLLSGPVRQIGWLQRGSMALRASAVVIDGRAVAIAGHAASGKSAVAAALALRGHRVLADSALPVEFDPATTARGVSDALGLWPDAVDQLGLDPDAGRVVRPALAKRNHTFPSARHAPLCAVAILERLGHTGRPRAERLRGSHALSVLSSYTAMAPLLNPLGLRAEHFRWITRLASQVRIFRVEVDRYRHDLPAVADAVEALAS